MLNGGVRGRGLVEALERSGLSRAEFCRRRGVSYQTMTYWVSRHREQQERTPLKVQGRGRDEARPKSRGEGAPPASFVEVSLPALAVPTGYEVRLGNGRCIRFGAAFDDEAVARLIRTLESC